MCVCVHMSLVLVLRNVNSEERRGESPSELSDFLCVMQRNCIIILSLVRMAVGRSDNFYGRLKWSCTCTYSILVSYILQITYMQLHSFCELGFHPNTGLSLPVLLLLVLNFYEMLLCLFKRHSTETLSH